MEKLDPKGIENILPLTSLQEGMLFHYLNAPRSNLYFEQLSLEIFGTIDFQFFEKAWNSVIQRNEMLRTIFRWEKLAKPSQVILKKHACEIRFHDFSEDTQKETAFAKIKTKDREEGFDLTRVSFRVTLCKLTETQYEMIVSNHHILYDGWSNGLILKEFFNAYYALSKREQALPLPAKPFFKEYVKWLQNRDKNKQRQFWRNYLADFETPMELPIKRKAEASTPPGDYSIILKKDIQNKLDIFAQNNRFTLAAIFYTAWGILLQKYGDSEDAIFGTTVSGRSGQVKGIEDMIGLFINTIPLRTQAVPGEKLIDMISRTDAALREREEFENTPLVDIQGCIPSTGGPLFDTIMA
ncbi:MAG: condensation domain-containing protein, partial [Acidobacteria bacterium]|nr:condensation domain-containing protein [Acidobacteriota bacterium]